jgi:hypothetical protein
MQNYVGKIIYIRRVNDPNATLAPYVCVGQSIDRCVKIVDAELSPSAIIMQSRYLTENGIAGTEVAAVVHDPEWIEQMVGHLEDLLADESIEWANWCVEQAEATLAALTALIVPEGAHAASECQPDPEMVKAAREAYASGDFVTAEEFIAERRGNKLRRDAKKRAEATGECGPVPLDVLRANYEDAAEKYEAGLLDAYCSSESLRIRKLFGWA